MAEELKPGAYWVLLYNSWTTAERRPDGFWMVPGNEIEFRRDEIQEIGPAIPTPDELRELREKARLWDEQENDLANFEDQLEKDFEGLDFDEEAPQ